jgi:ABC-type nitrate/sulfonate/bicarbonate transport system permease component
VIVIGQRLVQLGVLIAILALWQFATANGRVNPLLLPSLNVVTSEFLAMLRTGAFWPDLRVTVYELVCAFALAATSGCLVGFLVARSSFTVRVFDPIIAGLYSVPMLLLFPLYVLIFGIESGSKIALGTTVAFFPVALSTISGLAYVDPILIAAARSMGASTTQMFFSVMLPAAFPAIITGLRLGLIIAFLSILGTETIASIAGLGHEIVSYAESMETGKMFAAIGFAILLTLALNAATSYVEAKVQRGGE